MVAGKRMTVGGKAAPALTRNRVVSMVGQLEDAKIAAILAANATVQDLEEAIAWAEAESDVMGEMEKRLTEPAVRIYRILMTSKATEPDRDR